MLLVQATNDVLMTFIIREHALQAKQILDNQTIHGHKLTCTIHGECKLLFRDVEPATEREDFEDFWVDVPGPVWIHIGPQYRQSEIEVARVVQDGLKVHFGLESFHLHESSEGKKVSATAVFKDSEGAYKASETVFLLGNVGDTRVFFDHLSSVKYRLADSLIRALSDGIDEVKRDIWKN